MEVATTVVLKDDRLAVDQRLVCREAANRLRDPRKAIREVGAAAAPDLDALALFAGEDAKAVPPKWPRVKPPLAAGLLVNAASWVLSAPSSAREGKPEPPS
jgi:hypothetical protein